MTYIPATAGVVTASGTYTPTLSNTTNISSSTPYLSQYMRVGSVVTVSGMIDVTLTANGATVLGITIPIASNFANANELGGSFTTGSLIDAGNVIADTSAHRATAQWSSAGSGSRTYAFIFTYRII